MLKFGTRKTCVSPKELLRNKLTDLILQYDPDEKLPNDIPTKWEKHGDLVLLPANSFQNQIWKNFGNNLWAIVASALKVERVARKHKIRNDDFRSPNVELLKGSDGWVIHIDNKIKYTFDVTKCMFSSGNISEKLRVASFDCEGETVVDLYAGIGYFTLPYLVHAKASLVHACEWNSHALEALERNLVLNGVKDRCIIHYGDNRKVCPEKVADRVNLGLIPSSEAGWETACRALKSSGGILHVHGNVTSYEQTKSLNGNEEPNSIPLEWNKWAKNVCSALKDILFKLCMSEWTIQILKIIHIKSYAPHIDHLALDVECRPCDTK